MPRNVLRQAGAQERIVSVLNIEDIAWVGMGEEEGELTFIEL